MAKSSSKGKKLSIDDLQKQKGLRVTPLTRIVFAVLIAVGVIGGLFAVAGSIGKANELPESEKITRSLSGKTVAEDRADAIEAAGALLISTNAPKTIAEAGDTIGELEGGDFSSLAPDFSERVRYYDAYTDNASFQSEVAMSIYSVAALAKEAQGGEIVADNSRSGTVRVDQETGIAQVPIDIFTGKDSPIAFEMVYVDGGWKLEPHTFSSYIRLSALLGAPSTAG